MLRTFAIVFSTLLSASMPAAAQDRPVKVGVLTDLSGPYASHSGKGSVEAARLAIEDYGGKVLGRPIVLITADHQNKPDVAGTIAREWYDREGVEVILDVALSSAGLAVQEVSRNTKKVVLLSTSASSLITGSACSPYSAQWTFDTYALSKGVAEALVKEGAATWFFITGDYAFGQNLQTDLTGFVTAAGGKVVGSVRHAMNSRDFASYLLQAQASRADVIALASSGEDLVNLIKQANEFGVTTNERLAVPLISIPQFHALGAASIQGVVASTAFVWNRTPQATAWSQRFFKAVGAMPADTQAANYSSLLHWLKAVDAAGTTDADSVMAKMRATPVSDMFAEHGELRANGAMVHDIYLVQAKPQAEMTGPWDYVKVLRVIPGPEAFRKVSESGCPLVAKYGITQ